MIRCSGGAAAQCGDMQLRPVGLQDGYHVLERPIGQRALTACQCEMQAASAAEDGSAYHVLHRGTVSHRRAVRDTARATGPRSRNGRRRGPLGVMRAIFSRVQPPCRNCIGAAWINRQRSPAPPTPRKPSSASQMPSSERPGKCPRNDPRYGAVGSPSGQNHGRLLATGTRQRDEG